MKRSVVRVCSWACTLCMAFSSVSAWASPLPEESSAVTSQAATSEAVTGSTEPETWESGSEPAETTKAEPEETLPATTEEETSGVPEETTQMPSSVPETTVPEESVQQTPLDAKSEQQTYLEAFVSRLYDKCLGRTAGVAEIAYWVERLASHQSTGVDVAYGFVFSDEYKGRRTSDEAYVRMLYQTVLGREVDSTGLADWTGRLSNGASRQRIFEGLANSVEYAEICASYQVEKGSYTSNEIQDKNPDLTSFVVRLYRTCLNRGADEGGLKDWVGRLMSGKAKGAEVVWGFMASDEMKAKKLSPSDYLDILYQAMMDRKPDTVGKNGWLSYFEKGVSERYIVRGFVGSQEFQELCRKYGIDSGVLDISEARDLYPEISGFVMRFYQVCMGRNPGSAELNGWVNDLQRRSVSSLQLASGFFFSEEYKAKNKNNSDFVSDVYRAMLGREADTAGKADWVNRLNKGTSRETLIGQIAGSQEFLEIGRSLGIVHTADGWLTIGSKVYYIVNDARQSGWQKIGGNRYYFDPKDGNARVTGWNYIDGLKYYFNGDGTLRTDLEGVIGSQSSYTIKVNRQCNTVTVYAKDGSNGYIIPVKSFICSTGASGATPVGTFATPNKYRWHELMNKVYGQWCTRIVGGVLFHSVYYHDYTNGTLYTSAYNQLGSSVSHGCVRLTAGDAKWIYDNCSLGTQVTVYDSSVAGPYGKPSAYQLPSWHTWDPTDPTANSRCQQRGCH